MANKRKRSHKRLLVYSTNEKKIIHESHANKGARVIVNKLFCMNVQKDLYLPITQK